jgi:hypothetical protein
VTELSPVVRAGKLRRWWKRRAERRKAAAAMAEIARFPKNGNAPKHDLPGALIVSLTSYPARFGTLHLTIKSLLDHTVRPDQIVLWIGTDAIGRLPTQVRELEGETFSIRACEDVGSFTKIVPALAAFPKAFIITADDDNYYPDFWLERLVAAYDRDNPTIVYHRGHRPTFVADGSLAPYREWEREVADSQSLQPGTSVMPTGVGGVLYPPGSLPADTGDLGLIRELCSTCDDSWLYFMWRKAGWTAKRTPTTMPELIDWPKTQKQSLRKLHRSGKKDEHLRALSEYFGLD